MTSVHEKNPYNKCLCSRCLTGQARSKENHCPHCSTKIRHDREKNIVEIKNGNDKYILCNPAAENRRFIPAIYNGRPIHVTKEEVITLLINAAAQNTYENI